MLGVSCFLSFLTELYSITGLDPASPNDSFFVLCCVHKLRSIWRLSPCRGYRVGRESALCKLRSGANLSYSLILGLVS